ncbi:MAG TPA: hypothetical protein VNB28_08940 [Methylomirabilota bacterium]|jgi:hypothetical protein|nr:hypothetical protein [Methylomirabilota bacterium]
MWRPRAQRRGLTNTDPEIASAGDEVCRLAAQLAAEAPQSAELIRQGVYSPALHDATQAVEWFRATLVRALHRRSSTLSRT